MPETAPPRSLSQPSTPRASPPLFLSSISGLPVGGAAAAESASVITPRARLNESLDNEDLTADDLADLVRRLKVNERQHLEALQVQREAIAALTTSTNVLDRATY